MLSLIGRERIPVVPVASQEEARSTRKVRGTPGSFHHSKSPQMTQSFPEELVYPALPRRSRGGPTHTMVAHGTALWESLVGMPGEKASWESLEGSHSCFDSREGKCDTTATALEESARACPHSRRGLTPWEDSRSTPRSTSALERNPHVPAPTSNKVLGPGIDGRGIPRGPEQLAWGLAFPEAIRAGP